MQRDPANTTKMKTRELHQHPDYIEAVELSYFLGVIDKKKRDELLKKRIIKSSIAIK
jgi:hypothetical protein